MNNNMTFMVIMASCLFAGNAFCADWKFYGQFTTVPDIENVLFYDADSTINANNSIKLWVKTILYSDIEKSLENKATIEKAAKKIAEGYNPPITKIYPKITNVIYLEEAANDPSIKFKSQILYQILCSDGKIRKVSGSSFNKDGVLEQRFGITKWEDIAPESNANTLAKILCGSK